MADDALAQAVADLLRQCPDDWAPVPTNASSEALRAITAAGFVERRVECIIQFPGDEKTERVVIEATGEYGFVEAVVAVAQGWWCRHGERWAAFARETGDVLRPIVIAESDYWRLTDDGRLAKADLERGVGATIDFALKRGFFDSAPKLLPDGRVFTGGVVRGHGRLVRLEMVQHTPIEVALASCAPTAAAELAKALADALARCGPPTPDAKRSTSPEAFSVARCGDGWRIEAFGEDGYLPDLRGLLHVATLLQRPGAPIPAEALVSGGSTGRMPSADAAEHGLSTDGHSKQAVADDVAIKNYRATVREYDADIAAAERQGDITHAEILRREREAVVAKLQAAIGPRGRRKFNTASDKLRSRVIMALRTAYKKLRDAGLPRTADHLEVAIVCENGAFTYRADPLPEWRVEI